MSVVPFRVGGQGVFRVPCDAFGRQLGRATLPGGSWTDCHDALGGELFSIMHESGIAMELEPRSMFNTLIPTAALLARGRAYGRGRALCVKNL